MAHRFVQVSFMFADRLKLQELEPVFTAIGDDWVRISALSWVLWTNKPAAHIFTLLRPYMSPQDQVLISALSNNDLFGFMSPWIWAWFNSKVPNWTVTGVAADNLRHLLPPSEFDLNG